MPFNLKRFYNSLEKNQKNNELMDLFRDLRINPDDPKEKLNVGNNIKKILKMLGTFTDDTTAQKIMMDCNCMGKSVLGKAMRIKRESKNNKELIDKLNKNHIGGGFLTIKGNTISGRYTRCYCGSISKSKEKIPILYCYCSAGWYRKLFENILEKPVNVKIIGTIMSGSDECKFEIKF